MKSKQWKTDTLNSSSTKVVKIRNDKELFAVISHDTEVVLDRQEAQFLLISLQKALMEKKCCDNQTKLYNHDETKWSCFYCGAHN